MNIYYVVSKYNEEIFKSFIENYLPKDRSFVIENENYVSMAQKYNHGISLIKDLQDDDIVIFVHEDVSITDSKNFENTVKQYFEENKNIGLAGVVGSSKHNGCGWWNTENYLKKGQWIQSYKDNKIKLHKFEHSNDVLVVDGVILFVKGDVCKKIGFDETLKGYHHYDNLICLNTLVKTNYDIGIVPVLIFHRSEGEINDDFKNGIKYVKSEIFKYFGKYYFEKSDVDKRRKNEIK